MQFGQELILKVQEIIYHFEGSMNKMMVDDKGTETIVAPIEAVDVDG